MFSLDYCALAQRSWTWEVSSERSVTDYKLVVSELRRTLVAVQSLHVDGMNWFPDMLALTRAP